MTRASSRKKDSTSVTRPIDCQLPRSASLVTTAGLMSTQTVRTPAGSMMPVAMLDGEPALDIDAQRRPEESRLHVVDRQRVACKQDLHVSELDQPGQVAAGAGVDHSGPGDDDDASA